MQESSVVQIYDKVSSDSPATYGALQMCFDLI